MSSFTQFALASGRHLLLYRYGKLCGGYIDNMSVAYFTFLPLGGQLAALFGLLVTLAHLFLLKVIS